MTSPYQKAVGKTSEYSPDTLASINMALHEAAEHVAKYASDINLKQVDMVILGGAALHMGGFRERIHDVDLLVCNLKLSTRMEQKELECPKSGKKVELFYDNKIGSLQDPKMFKRSTFAYQGQWGSVGVSVRAYPPEFLLLMKIDQSREKCLGDISTMLQGISLVSLAEAFNELSQYNEPWIMSEIADQIVTDIIMLSLPGTAYGDEAPDIKGFCMNLRIDQDKKDELTMICRHMEMQSKIKAKRVKPAVPFDSPSI